MEAEPLQLPSDPRQLVPRIRRAWYVLATSAELGATPLKRRLFGQDLVVWRGAEGRVAAFRDRCPHRNIPLSTGRVVDGCLECPYHGWRFDPSGDCVRVPGLSGPPGHRSRRAEEHPARERQGFVWVWGDLDSEPEGEPFHFPLADDPGYLTVRRTLKAPGSVHAVAENALDVPHTAFVHGGLFRQDGERKPIRTIVQRWADRVECEYVGEARPSGLVGQLLSPSGGVVVHYDRFFLPSIVQVEYRIGEENHLILNGALTPEDDHETALHACVSLRTRFPGWLVQALVTPVALYIFGQDITILRQQTSALATYGDARYASTDLDLLGPHILKLMRRAARGEVADPHEAPWRREGEMLL